MNITGITPKALRRAADIQERIQSLQGELNSILGGPAEVAAAPTSRKRRISAAGRAAIAAAARARWAKYNAGKPGKAAKAPTRKISAAGRRRLAALARARWARVKAAGRKSL